jgi:prevent-host-death family protein
MTIMAMTYDHIGDDMPAKQKKVTTVPAGQFKARCLALMEHVDRTGEEIVVTKRNRPVAKLVPIRAAAPPPPPSGRSKGRLQVVGDIVAPIDADWDVGADY